MAEKKAEKKATKATKEVKERKVKEMSHGADQSKDRPPKVEKGQKSVWHDGYEYEGKNGTITVRGHWEVMDEPEPKEKEAKKKS